METSTPAAPGTILRIVCETCGEESLVAPSGTARYGIVDCPSCGTTYLIALPAAAHPH